MGGLPSPIRDDDLGQSPSSFLYSEDFFYTLKKAHLEGNVGNNSQIQVNQILTQAAEALDRSPGSVVDKEKPGPSGDLRDYYHPAPYWWPNPNTFDGLPPIKCDGKRAPGTVLYSDESNQYDRTRLQYLFDDAISLAFAWKITGDKKYVQHGIECLHRWFLDPQTRMNPHLKFAQVRPGDKKGKGTARGIIEMKDLYFYLEAVKIFIASGELNTFGTCQSYLNQSHES